MRAFLLGASLAVILAGCAQHGELKITAVGERESRADDGTLAKAHLLLGRGEQALAVDAYRKVIRQDPGNAAAYNGLAIAYDQLGRNDLSRRYYEQALAYAPREAKYYRNLARSLERQGLKNEAAKVLAQMAALEGAPAPAPERASPRSLAQIARQKLAALTDAASGVIRPHLERLSMGEVLLETKAEEAPVMAGRLISVPIPMTETPPDEPKIAARPAGHSITVAIPDAEPVAEAHSAPNPTGSETVEIAMDIPLATLTSTSALESASEAPPLLLASAAADSQELLALAFRPAPDSQPSCDYAARPTWVSEYDMAPSGTRMTVFTGDFRPMRLGGGGITIDLPLLYPASHNLPVMAAAPSINASCAIRMADAPTGYDSLFNSLWLDWTDEDSAA